MTVVQTCALPICYFLYKRVSIRVYLDIVAPSIMLGLAFGRVGCTLNGCCFGSVCATDAGEARLPWTITFPYASPAYERQWRRGELAVPDDLIVRLKDANALLPRESLYFAPEKLDQRLADIKAIQDPEQRTSAIKANENLFRQHTFLLKLATAAGKIPSDFADHALARRSLPVQPTQIYSCINALMLWILLAIIFRIRRRHGVVMPWMFVLYGASRMILEQIRSDNPHDIWIFTISQAVGLAMIVIGTLWLLILRKFPMQSPRAIPWTPPAPPAAA